MVCRGYKRAISATAHTLARYVFAVLRDRTPDRDPDTDDEAQVQAPAALQTRVGVSFRQSPTLQPLTLK